MRALLARARRQDATIGAGRRCGMCRRRAGSRGRRRSYAPSPRAGAARVRLCCARRDQTAAVQPVRDALARLRTGWCGPVAGVIALVDAYAGRDAGASARRHSALPVFASLGNAGNAPAKPDWCVVSVTPRWRAARRSARQLLARSFGMVSSTGCEPGDDPHFAAAARRDVSVVVIAAWQLCQSGPARSRRACRASPCSAPVRWASTTSRCSQPPAARANSRRNHPHRANRLAARLHYGWVTDATPDSSRATRARDRELNRGRGR